MTLQTTLAVEFNNTNGPINETIAGQTLNFTQGSFVKVDGTATLGILGFVDLSGSFSFEKSTDSQSNTVLKIGRATGVTKRPCWACRGRSACRSRTARWP